MDLLVKHQPTSRHVVRLILPLVELISGTGTNERQLSDKAKGILTSRITKLKETPPSFDESYAIKALDDLHIHARKLHNPELIGVLSQCSLFLSKLLFHAKEEQAVLRTYQESLMDYATRKSCTLNARFLQDFIRRYPSYAWDLGDKIVHASSIAVNVFRKCQILHLLEVPIKQAAVSAIS